MAEAVVSDIDRPQFRPFTLGDAMILVIALALGLVLARSGIGALANHVRSVPLKQFRTLAVAVKLGRTLNILLLNFLWCLLPAFLILRLRRPRAPFRSLILQPGFAACAAVLAAHFGPQPFVRLAPAGLARQAIEMGGLVLLVAAVPVVWVTLIVTHRWNPESSWVDTLGRILGLLWTICLTNDIILIILQY